MILEIRFGSRRYVLDLVDTIFDFKILLRIFLSHFSHFLCM